MLLNLNQKNALELGAEEVDKTQRDFILDWIERNGNWSVHIGSYHKMNPTTVLRGILQKLKRTITRSLEAYFFAELATTFFLGLKYALE